MARADDVQAALNAIRDRDFQSLLERKKLHLMLDLDQTLVHTRRRDLLTSEEQKLTSLRPIAGGSFMVKLRPGVDVFLEEASTMFDLSIFTKGNQNYACLLAQLLENSTNDGNNFRFRGVFSRGNCSAMKQKTLDVVSSYERAVLIVDDKVKVWKECNHSNVIQIGGYEFFGLNSTSSEVDQEEVMDEELVRVLRTLRSVHAAFYADLGCAGRDVRQLLKRVEAEEDNNEEGEVENDNGGQTLCLFEQVMAKNRKRSQEQEVLCVVPLDSYDPRSKRRKFCNVSSLPCLAC